MDEQKYPTPVREESASYCAWCRQRIYAPHRGHGLFHSYCTRNCYLAGTFRWNVGSSVVLAFLLLMAIFLFQSYTNSGNLGIEYDAAGYGAILLIVALFSTSVYSSYKGRQIRLEYMRLKH
jgi:hypothetical protein